MPVDRSRDGTDRGVDRDACKGSGEHLGQVSQSQAINALARGLGAARSGDVETATSMKKHLDELNAKAPTPYWKDQIAIQSEVVASLTLCAENKVDKCITDLRAAAEHEDATEKHVVSPGPILPAREVLADMLREHGKPAEALAEYEKELSKEPNRLRAMIGTYSAAKAAGQDAKMREYAKAIANQTEASAPGRKVTDEAKTDARAG